MSGHSKWAGIKHKKAITDARRGQLFTRLAREIEVAAREGGGGPDNNFRLRLVMQKAREANMPADNIDRAIKRGTGELEGSALEQLRYEGYASHGVAVMVDAMTDNRNRTSAAIKHLFSKFGGNLGESGCVAWMFRRIGLIYADLTTQDSDEVGLVAIEAGAEDISMDGSTLEVSARPESFETVRGALEAQGLTMDSAEVTMHPTTTVPLAESEAVSVLRLIDALEELEDVQEVYANFDIPDAVLERVSAKV